MLWASACDGLLHEKLPPLRNHARGAHGRTPDRRARRHRRRPALLRHIPLRQFCRVISGVFLKRGRAGSPSTAELSPPPASASCTAGAQRSPSAPCWTWSASDSSSAGRWAAGQLREPGGFRRRHRCVLPHGLTPPGGETVMCTPLFCMNPCGTSSASYSSPCSPGGESGGSTGSIS